MSGRLPFSMLVVLAALFLVTPILCSGTESTTETHNTNTNSNNNDNDHNGYNDNDNDNNGYNDSDNDNNGFDDGDENRQVNTVADNDDVSTYTSNGAIKGDGTTSTAQFSFDRTQGAGASVDFSPSSNSGTRVRGGIRVTAIIEFDDMNNNNAVDLGEIVTRLSMKGATKTVVQTATGKTVTFTKGVASTTFILPARTTTVDNYKVTPLQTKFTLNVNGYVFAKPTNKLAALVRVDNVAFTSIGATQAVFVGGMFSWAPTASVNGAASVATVTASVPPAAVGTGGDDESSSNAMLFVFSSQAPSRLLWDPLFGVSSSTGTSTTGGTTGSLTYTLGAASSVAASPAVIMVAALLALASIMF